METLAKYYFYKYTLPNDANVQLQLHAVSLFKAEADRCESAEHTAWYTGEGITQLRDVVQTWPTVPENGNWYFYIAFQRVLRLIYDRIASEEVAVSRWNDGMKREN